MSRNGLLLLGGWLLSGLLVVIAPPVLTGVATFLFVLVGWVVALAVHEFSHAWIAWKAGDHTVSKRGYLTFDPLLYADLATSLVLPVIVLAIGGIALPGGAVYLRPDLMRGPRWRAAASLAGPVGTLLCLLVLGVFLAVGGLMGLQGPLMAAVALLALFQAMAFIFNLLPVPGLDGYGVIRPFLPARTQKRLAPLEPVAIYGLIAILFLAPGASGQLFEAALGLTNLVGIDPVQVAQGYVAFHFWR